jgi:FSR family fosmidomycin resistance protein-like MFS transporter
LGGVLGDRYGWKRIAVAGLLAAAPLLSFFPAVPALTIAGAFCFNLTMPVTLTAIANMLPGRAGFAFGLTTLALIVGALPAFTGLKPMLGQPWAIMAAIAISVVVLYAGLKLYRDRF